MNTNIDHLTDWQIEELILRAAAGLTEDIAAGLSKDVQAHLAMCSACRSRKAALEETLLLYRRAAFVKAEDAMRPSAASFSAADMPSDSFFGFDFFGRWRAHAVAFLVMLILLIPAFVARERHEQRARQEAQTHAVREQTKDDLLLQQVDQEITESVPQPMQSLTQPVLADENSSTNE